MPTMADTLALALEPFRKKFPAAATLLMSLRRSVEALEHPDVVIGSRQVVVEADVWDRITRHAARYESLFPAGSPEREMMDSIAGSPGESARYKPDTRLADFFAEHNIVFAALRDSADMPVDDIDKAIVIMRQWIDEHSRVTKERLR
jgi:hypothetical protein